MKTIERIQVMEHALQKEICKSTDYELLIKTENRTMATYIETKGLRDALNFIDETIDNLMEAKRIRIEQARNVIRGDSMNRGLSQILSRNTVNRLFSPFGYNKINIKDIDNLIKYYHKLWDAINNNNSVYYAFKVNEDYTIDLRTINICSKNIKALKYKKENGDFKFYFDDVEVFCFVIDGMDETYPMNITTNGEECVFFNENMPNSERFLSYMDNGFLLVTDVNESVHEALEKMSCWSICKDCGEAYHLTIENIRWYRDRGLQPPRRCDHCRYRRKINKRQAEYSFNEQYNYSY